MDDDLRRSVLFQGISDDAAEAVAASLARRTVHKGERVFVEGEQGDRLFVILRGKVKVGRKAADGRENMLALLGPGSSSAS